jgi:ribulose-phosphate 3-epimerase
VQQIRELGVGASVTINPATPLNTLEEILPYVDMVLLMTVNPGFGGQAFIETMYHKIAALRETVERRGLNIDIEVDGGVHLDTVGDIAAAGANVLVSGSAIFRHNGEHASADAIARAIAALRQAAEAKKARPT